MLQGRSVLVPNIKVEDGVSDGFLRPLGLGLLVAGVQLLLVHLNSKSFAPVFLSHTNHQGPHPPE